MLRFLTSRLAAPGSWRSKLTFPDPEHLAQLAGALAERSADSTDLSREFSAYVSSIRIVGHISKLTRPNRLCQMNQALCQQLRALTPADVTLLDLGGSDGVTTLELVEHLEAELGVEVRAWMLDLYVRLLRYARGGVVEYRMADGAPIMLRVGPVGLQLSSLASTRDPVSRILGRLYLGRARFRQSMPLDGSISLINPHVTRDRRIAVTEWNALERNSELIDRATVARASNILNRVYFSDDQILCAAGHLHAYLHEGGLLVISRNRSEQCEELEAGSIWRKEGDRFLPLENVGGGSEVADLIENFRADSTSARAAQQGLGIESA